MSIVHKQISPVAASGKESETWDTYRLMRHLEMIGPDKNMPEKEDKYATRESHARKERKRRVEENVYETAPNGKRVREVPGHRHYYATEDGEIYSGRQGSLRPIKIHNGNQVYLQGNYGQTYARVDRMVDLAWE